ncbi:MAG: glycosyltransferase family 9 protein [Magnetovibrio sp.]|nr:glycosyltransferase family 9 protein [Magnetovibrio sp.]
MGKMPGETALKRILFITSNRLGDAVLSLGVLAHLLDEYPGARTTVVCGPVPAGLFAAVPGLERVIELPKRKHSLHWWEMWRKCVGTCWDVVVDLRNAPLSYALLSKRQIHLGKANKKYLHRVVAMGSLVGRADNPPVPQLWSTPEHDAAAAKLIPDGTPVLALGPTANWIGKTWYADRFVELALRLTAEDGILSGGRIAVMAHTSELEMAQPVLDALPRDRILNLVGDIPLATVGACLRRASFYIGNDSGLMHMAAAAGIPTLGLFGPSREDLYAPWGGEGGKLAMSVRGDKALDELFPPDYDYRNTPSLMGDLSVDKAEQAAKELWSRLT